MLTSLSVAWTFSMFVFFHNLFRFRLIRQWKVFNGDSAASWYYSIIVHHFLGNTLFFCAHFEEQPNIRLLLASINVYIFHDFIHSARHGWNGGFFAFLKFLFDRGNRCKQIYRLLFETILANLRMHHSWPQSIEQFRHQLIDFFTLNQSSAKICYMI